MAGLKLRASPHSYLDAFIKDCRLRGMTDESIRRYVSSLRIFLDFLSRENADPFEISHEHLKEFLYELRFERNVKSKTIENYFSAISAFYEFLVFEGFADRNPVLSFRKRYLRQYKEDYDASTRKLISVEEMSRLVNSIMDPRDKAIVVLFAKTGIRRGELIGIDVDDIDWNEYSITLKPRPKRSNRVVFFDDECALVLRRWLRVRETLDPKTKALFVNYQSRNRIDRNTVYSIVTKYAERLGLHNPSSPRLEDHFSPHCIRHWFTTWLIENGMPRDYVKELRGDRRREAVDIYYHISREELRRAYLAYVPKLGIE
jgi:integrase/recombinase XerD